MKREIKRYIDKFNIKTFIQINKEINNILGTTPIKTKVVTVNYNNKIGEGNNINHFINAFDEKGKKTLVVAPAGTGKTYTLNKVFDIFNQKRKDMIEDITENFNDYKKITKFNNVNDMINYFSKKENKVINIILCPNRVQNEQNQDSYGLKAIIGDGKSLVEYVSEDESKFSMVFDLILAILDVLNENTNINLCIDEAHLLVEYSNFKKSIIDIELVVDKITEFGGSVVYMTATPEPLMAKNFDTIIDFQSNDYKVPTKKLTIHRTSKKNDFLEFAYKVIDNTKKPMYRYNNIEKNKKLMDLLRFESGKHVVNVNSAENRKYKKVYDAKTDKIKKVPYNVISNAIINDEIVPLLDKNNKNKTIDAYSFTSMIEVGSNILGVGIDKNNYKQDENLCPIYLCPTANDMNINSMVQFFNRIRYSVNEWKIVMPFNQDDNNFIPLTTMFKDEYEKLPLILKSFSLHLEAIKIMTSNKEEIINQMNSILHYIDIDGKKNNFNYIYIDENTLEIKYNENKFFKHVYSMFNKQYFNNQTLFLEKIANEFDTQIVIIDNFNDITEKTKYNSLNEFLTEILNSKELQNQMLRKKFIDKRFKIYKNHNKFKKVYELLDITKNVKEALELILALDSESVNIFLKEIACSSDLQDQMLNIKEQKDIRFNIFNNHSKYLTVLNLYKFKKDLSELCNKVAISNDKELSKYRKTITKEILKNINTSAGNRNLLAEVILSKKPLIEIEDKNLADKIYTVLKDDTYSTMIKRNLKANYSIKETLNLITTAKTDSEVNNKILQKQYIENNMKFINGNEIMLSGKAGLEQLCILKNLYVLNASGNLYQKTIDGSILESLTVELNKMTGYKYNTKQVKKIINLCFRTETINKCAFKLTYLKGTK